MSKVTITIDETTLNFLMAGMAYTTYVGKKATQEARAIAQADFDAAVKARTIVPDPIEIVEDCTQCGDTDRVEWFADEGWLCAGCQ